jgi:hypothetical protein
MTLTQLQQLVGPINRGQLEQGFIAECGTGLSKEKRYFEEGELEAASTTPPPPPIEDLSWMNPRCSAFSRKSGRRAWLKLTPEEREKRREQLSAAAVKGGMATKNVRHRHY